MSTATTSIHRAWLCPVLAASVFVLSGCGLLPQSPHPHKPSRVENVPLGERPGSIPRTQKGGGGASPASTPHAAILRFASLYINWTYKNLVSHERTLASIAVGGARLAEQQAATQTARDTTIARAHIYNRGRVIGIAPVIAPSGDRYVVVTREQTGGDPEYAGLQPAYHVTLATVTRLPGGFAVAQWEPES
jgi:hypothetical protein